MASTDGGPRRIGAVVALLHEEFPDITISKIRFLEAEGLVEPQRTPAGYRLYAAADVERLRYILAAQRDRFWPLKVIREALEAIDRGLTPQEPDAGLPRPPAPAQDPDLPHAAELAAAPMVRLTAAELGESTGASGEVIEALVGFGLLHPDPAGLFDAADAQVAQACVGLAAFGIEPRHLRAFRAAADREVGLIEQALITTSAEQRPMRGGEIARLCLQLHAGLVKGGLHRS